MNKFPIKPRYNFVRKSAYKFLINNGISKLPFDIDHIYAANGWYIDSVSVAENIATMLCPLSLNNSDCAAVTAHFSDKYITLYDDNCIPERLYWTKGHELGHIFLEHLIYVANSNFSELPVQLRSTLEREANLFTSELLAPLPILHFAGCKTASDIKLLCGISNEASEIALTCLQKWSPKNTASERMIIRHFFDFIVEQPHNLFGMFLDHTAMPSLPEGFTVFNDWKYALYIIKNQEDQIYPYLLNCTAGYSSQKLLTIVTPDTTHYERVESNKQFVRHILHEHCGMNNVDINVCNVGP